MRRLLPALLLGALLAGAFWLRPEPEAHLVVREFPAMGTWNSVTIWVEDLDRLDAAHRAAAAVEQRMHAFDARWSPTGDGELARINDGRLDRFPDAMQPLLERSLSWHERSGGLFDPRLGALITLWGFDEPPFGPRPPAPEAIAALLPALRTTPAARDGAPWNFGAIAKGWIVDRCVDALADAGFGNVLINSGGNLRVAGRRGDRPWRIAIRHPRPEDGRRFLLVFDAGDEAIVTSGDYERYFEYQGVRYHHILDPRSGQPARGLQSLTVIAPQAADADAAATALFVAGPDGWPRLARALDLAQVVAVDAQGRITATPEAARRFDLPAIGGPPTP